MFFPKFNNVKNLTKPDAPNFSSEFQHDTVCVSQFAFRYLRRMLLLPFLDLGLSGIYILITGRTELVGATLINTVIFGLTVALFATWSFRPIAEFEHLSLHQPAAIKRITELPWRSAWAVALLVLVLNTAASAFGTYIPVEADLGTLTNKELAIAAVFYPSIFALMYSYFSYFAVNDLCIEMRGHWRDRLDFGVSNDAKPNTNKFRCSGLALRLHAIFTVIGVLPALLVVMDLTVLAPIRALQGLSTLNVIVLDLTAALYIIIASKYFVTRSLLVPVRELIYAHEQVRKGSLQYRAAILTSDELGEVASRFNTMVIALRERQTIKSALERYLGSGVALELIASGGLIATRTVEATVMFTDIDDFTSLAESLEPHETMELLNSYFSLVNRVIAREGGVINNFIGDAVVAIFNLPSATLDHAHAAVRAALALQKEVSQQSFELPNTRKVFLSTRIGIHTGPVCAGNIGAVDRQGYTVYGDAVNLAARIEPLNKRFGTRILVSEDTRDLARLQGSSEDFSLMEQVKIRGRCAPVVLYSLL